MVRLCRGFLTCTNVFIRATVAVEWKGGSIHDISLTPVLLLHVHTPGMLHRYQGISLPGIKLGAVEVDMRVIGLDDNPR